ncbi:MAG: A/G-specific adenine glycosylase [Candidatus Saccharimonadales bacterium]
MSVKNEEFIELLWQKGHELYREMPWRKNTRAYYVLVSELMLQQTQVERVIPKFQAFITVFPDEKTLARASLSEVLKIWQGLGYNRRAKFLHEAAKKILERGSFPDTLDELMQLPGVGKNTAGAILAYSFNRPVIFIETNIRTVYIRHFFADDFDIDDKTIIGKLETTLDHEHPREFYQALMDYGSDLKRSGVRNILRSKHYKKQSALKGSVREVRGQVIAVLSSGDMTLNKLKQRLVVDERFDKALAGLQKDGLVSQTGAIFHLTN